jgi:hypothetical protein
MKLSLIARVLSLVEVWRPKGGVLARRSSHETEDANTDSLLKHDNPEIFEYASAKRIRYNASSRYGKETRVAESGGAPFAGLSRKTNADKAMGKR